MRAGSPQTCMQWSPTKFKMGKKKLMRSSSNHFHKKKPSTVALSTSTKALGTVTLL